MRKAFRIVLVNLAVLVVGMVVIELVFGGWVGGPGYGQINIPRNTQRSFDVGGLYAGGGVITYTRDGHGLRGAYADASGIDVLTIGGSTTNQLYIDDKKTWQARLADRFRRAGNPQVIVDASIDGQSTLGHIAVFERWFPLVPGLRARFVLAYVGINDMHVEGATRYDAMESPDLSRRIRQVLLNHSAFYGLFRTARGVLRARRAKLIHGASPYTGVTWERAHAVDAANPGAAELAPRLDAYRARLGVLMGKIRRFGARPVIVTQPLAGYRIRDGLVWGVRGKDGSVSTGGYHEITAFNQAAMAACRAEGALCIDLAGELLFKDGDFYDGLHNTPRGAAKIGLYLYEKLKDVL